MKVSIHPLYIISKILINEAEEYESFRGNGRQNSK
jgi:hypothetical protein